MVASSVRRCLGWCDCRLLVPVCVGGGFIWPLRLWHMRLSHTLHFLSLRVFVVYFCAAAKTVRSCCRS